MSTTMETTLIEVVNEEKPKEQVERTYSNDTFYTDSSEGFRSKCKSAANLLQKRRQLHPLMGNGPGSPYRAASTYGPRFITFHSPSKINMTDYSQKIMSAKLLQVKQLRNELTEAQFQLNELATENKLLKTLQKRQDLALKKYEGTKAELPQLIRSHNEEVRVLRSKVKQLKAQCREKDHRIKELDADVQSFRDQNRHLLKLSRDRQLGDREQLTKQVEELQEIIKDQDVRIQTLNRKVLLESKNFKHQLATEMMHHKETQRSLHEALTKITKLEMLVESKEKYIATYMPKKLIRNSASRPSVSMVSLAGASRFPNLHGAVKSETELNPRLEEELSEDTYVASQANTSYGSTIPSNEPSQLIADIKMATADGYAARRMKLASMRKALLDKILPEPSLPGTNKLNDIVSSSGLTSRTPSSLSLQNDEDLDATDDNTKQPYSFGSGYESRNSSRNTVTSKKLSHEEKIKSLSNISLDEKTKHEGKGSDTSFSDSSHKEEKTDCMHEKSFYEFGSCQKDDVKRKNATSSSPSEKETKSEEDRSSSGKIIRRGSLIGKKRSSLEEDYETAVSQQPFSRRGSLNEDKNSDEDTVAKGVPIHLSRKGSLTREKNLSSPNESLRNFLNRRGSLTKNVNSYKMLSKPTSRRGSLNSDIALRLSVDQNALNKSGENSETDDAELKNSSTCTNSTLAEACERLNEISQSYTRIHSTLQSEKEKTKAKLLQYDSESEPVSLEGKSFEKEKLLAALKAIDEGEDPPGVGKGESSSILESFINNPKSGTGVSLPFLGQVRILDASQENRESPRDRSPSGDRLKKLELMQELFGAQSLEHKS